MEIIRKLRVLTIATFFVVFSQGPFALSGVCLASSPEPGFIEELQEGEEESTVKIGKIDSIDEQGVVIDDQAYSITPETRYRADGGSLTAGSHFSAGDPVKFICDYEAMVLIELQMDLSGPVAEWLESQKGVDSVPSTEKKGADNVILKDGVWTN